MKKKSRWCKEVQKALIDRDMTVTGLADAVGFAREYVSKTVNGSQCAPAVAEKISAYLGITVPYDIAKASPVTIVQQS